MYKWSSLHLKRRRSTCSEQGVIEEEHFKDQHEVRVSVQPFDVVVWCPAIVSAMNAFDLHLVEQFRFLAECEPVADGADGMVHCKGDEDSEAEIVTVNVELLPLLFVNIRNLRLFVPSVKTSEELDVSSCNDVARFLEDMAVMQLSSVAVCPHPDNPVSRIILNQRSYEKFRRFGRSSRQALGYDVHDVQYQVDICGFGVWSGSWGQLCGRLKRDAGLDEAGIAMDQNPALEWNTQIWYVVCRRRLVSIFSVKSQNCLYSTRHFTLNSQ